MNDIIVPNSEGNFLPSDGAFLEFLSQVTNEGVKSGDDYFRITITPSQREMSLLGTDKHERLYGMDDLADLKIRYDKLAPSVQKMIASGFTITTLYMSATNNYSITILEYLTPNNKKMTTRYIRDNLPKNLICDDLLHDLQMIPTRPY